MRRPLLLLLAQGALTAGAQPRAAPCYAPDRNGWQGPSGLTYRLERSENGAAFLSRAMTANTQAVDALDVVGGLCWRLVAIDGAGNFGTSDGGASLTVDAADAGLDAGLPGGEDPEDAGVDRAEPLLLSVGCGCDGGAGSLSWLTLFWLVGPAKKRRARRASC